MRTRTLATAVLLSLLTATVGTAVPAFGAPRTPTVQPRPQRYLVQTASASTTSAVAGSVRQAGGQVQDVYARALTGFSATLTPEQVVTLRADRHVRSVVADRLFHSTTVQTTPTWGLDRLDQRAAGSNGSYRYGTNGRGVTAFVLDTGIRMKHSQFGGRASSGYDFVDRDKSATDCAGHGTHVSGTIGGSTYGAAKAVRLVGVRVLDCDGFGWAGDIIHGLDWVIAHKPAGPAVVNMSIGGEAYGELDKAVKRTVAAGIPVVVAAGNDGENACRSSPARVAQAITVAATDEHDKRPSWSDYGRCVDLFAPGVDIRSATSSSDHATEVMSGTSMAAPHVTGLVARYLQGHRSATPAQATAALIATATTKAVKNLAGSPNRLLYAAAPAGAPGLSKVTVRKSDKAGTATITWSAPRDSGGKAVTAYRVSRSGRDARGSGALTVTVSARTRTHTFTRLKKGSSYTLSVRAVNSLGTGPSAAKKISRLK